MSTDNAQGEKYLTDVLAIARSAGRRVSAHLVDDLWQTEGVNDRVQLATLGRELNRRVCERWMRAGVTILDPATTWVDTDVTIGPDTTILPGTQLLGATRIGSRATVGPDTTLTDTEVGDGATIRRTDATLSVIGAGASVGPFAYLRPGSDLGAAGKIGTFVETKNSRIGEGSKVPHLSYVGDATIGKGSNIGASSVFVNYDGVTKSRTVVGDHVRMGSDNMYVAPVTIGDGAYSGAGAVLREDVPAGALAITVAPQRNVAGWVERRRPGTAAAAAAAAARGDGTPESVDADDAATRRRRRSPGMTGILKTTEKNLMVFSGRANPELAEEVTRQLGSSLVPTSAYEFANGEIYVRYEESVRGCDAFVIQSHSAPINEAIMEQLIMIDALKRASAKRITVVLPFYGYARQDKKHRGREPISARLMADMFKTAGADRLMAVDLHTDQIQGFFDGPVDHLMALPILSEYVRDNYGDERLAVVSPDAGRIKVAEQWSNRLGGAPLAFIHKTRDISRPNETVANRVVGDVAGRVCVLVDDMIDTAGTITKAADALAEQGQPGWSSRRPTPSSPGRPPTGSRRARRERSS